MSKSTWVWVCICCSWKGWHRWVFDHCRDSQPEVVFSGSRTTFELTSGLPIPVSIFSTHNVMVALHDYIWETNFEAFKIGESSEKIPPHRNQRGRKPGSKRRQVRAKQQSSQDERTAALRGVAGRQSHSRWSWEKDRAWTVTQPLRMGRRLGMCSSPNAHRMPTRDRTPNWTSSPTESSKVPSVVTARERLASIRQG